MSLGNLFAEECLQVGTEVRDKPGVIRAIAALAKKNPLLADIPEEELCARLMAREELSTTGFAEGVAMPHCFFDELKEFVVGLLVAPEGVDFQAMDGKPTQLLFFIIAPSSRRNKHIKILSSISRMVKNPGIIHALSTVRSGRELNAIVNRSIQYSDDTPFVTEQCQLVLYLQQEDVFDDILEILSASSEGAVSVIEAANAGYYLHRLPLFSTFWNDNKKRFNRVIISVVRKQLLNDVIRQVYAIRDGLAEEPGLMITAADLTCCLGKINY